jgi:hypothetical protein
VPKFLSFATAMFPAGWRVHCVRDVSGDGEALNRGHLDEHEAADLFVLRAGLRSPRESIGALQSLCGAGPGRDPGACRGGDQ